MKITGLIHEFTAELQPFQKNSHPEHKSGPDLKIVFNAATQNCSKKGIHIKHRLQACKTEGNTASIRKALSHCLSWNFHRHSLSGSEMLFQNTSYPNMALKQEGNQQH